MHLRKLLLYLNHRFSFAMRVGNYNVFKFLLSKGVGAL